MKKTNLKHILEQISFLWSSLSPKRHRQLLFLQLLSLAAAVGEVANLGALFPVLQLLANPRKGISFLGPLSALFRDVPNQQILLTFGLIFILVVVSSTILRVVTIQRQLRLAAFISADLGEKVLTSVLMRPYAWHLAENSSTVIGNLTKDVDQVSASILALLNIIVNLSIVLFLSTSLIALAPSLMTIVVIVITVFYFLVFSITRKGLKADGERLISNYQGSLQVAQEALGGIRDVLLDRSQPFFIQAYAAQNINSRLAMASINSKAQIPRYLIEGFIVLLIISISLGYVLFGQGLDQQLPVLGTLVLGAYRLLQPLQQCFGALSSLQANQASLLQLKPFLIPQTEKYYLTRRFTAEDDYQPNQPQNLLIQLKDLSFRYSSHEPIVLKSLNLDINQGERVAFVGTTGSGKTTCCDIILGLLIPSSGSLLIQGKELHNSQCRVEGWQRRIAHVPQQIFLSDSSFASNIAFGIPENLINLNRVIAAAKKARISTLIESSPDGYSTIVGERGVRLSGGQRQRIGIARALYKRAELLILDEATSALDNRTEAEVMAAVNELDRSITVIMIAHRLSTVKHCDRIVLLENGVIKAIGTFDELVTSSPDFCSFLNYPRHLLS
jgi:ABC-type multidrug transport system fused ATPase/permease subunit